MADGEKTNVLHLSAYATLRSVGGEFDVQHKLIDGLDVFMNARAGYYKDPTTGQWTPDAQTIAGLRYQF